MKTMEVHKATTLDKELKMPRAGEIVFSKSALRNNITWTEKVVFMSCICICVYLTMYIRVYV